MVANEFEDAPLWLTESYLEPILRKHKKDTSLKIVNLVIRPATAKGENYASVMARVTVSFRQDKCKDLTEESYLVKTAYENDETIFEIMKHYDPYSTEMLMYEKILPELDNLLAEIGESEKLFAETIQVRYDNSAIIFEDLSKSRYVMVDRVTGMDKVHAKLALKNLAKMHASAAVYNERHPNILTKLDHGIFNRYTKGLAPYFESVVKQAAEFAGSTPELGTYFKEKLFKLSEKVVDYATKANQPKDGLFNTLIHGDYWVNNLMVQYDEELPTRITNLKIIDFQFCTWSTPAIDLHYFLNTSMIDDLKFNHQDELVQYYHENLVKLLKAFNFRGYVPTLQEFRTQLEVDRFYAVVATLIFQPVMINSETQDADFHTLLGNDEKSQRFKQLVYSNKRVHENVKRLLPIFDRRGLLDIDN